MFDDFKIPKIREFEDLTTFPAYETGIYERDKALYRLKLDKTKNPNMICPYELKDGEETLSPGYYEVALSDDKRYFLLIQSRELKALVPAIKVIQQKRSNAYEKRVSEIEEERKKLQKKRKTTQKLDDELANMQELELNAKISDSKQGYYIIEYKKFDTYAWGYVPY